MMEADAELLNSSGWCQIAEFDLENVEKVHGESAGIGSGFKMEFEVVWIGNQIEETNQSWTTI